MKDDLRGRLIHPVGDHGRLGIGMEPDTTPDAGRNYLRRLTTFPAFELTRQPTELDRSEILAVPTSEQEFLKAAPATLRELGEFDTMLDRYFSTIPRRERTEVRRARSSTS